MANLFPDGWLDEIVNGREIQLNKPTYSGLVDFVARKIDLFTAEIPENEPSRFFENIIINSVSKEDITVLSKSKIEKNGMGEGSIDVGATKSLEQYYAKVSLMHLLCAWQQLGQKYVTFGRYIFNVDRNTPDKKINLESILDNILVSAKAEARLEAYQEVTKILGSDKKYAEALTVTIQTLDNFKNEKIARETGINIINENSKKLTKFAQKIAKELWKNDKDKKIRIGQMCDEIFDHVQKYAETNDAIDQLPANPEGLKSWLREIAPGYASQGGRPPKN